MYTRQDPSQQWTVHAQFTISHDGQDPNTTPTTHTEHDENGVRMVYTWTSQPPEEPKPNTFQKGNLLFTSTPPNKPFQYPENKNLNVDSSGYSSELLSPNSLGSSNLPRRNSQPYNRRCRSTCSIVLSTNFNETKTDDSECQSQCGRTHSLRCQTPTLRCERKDAFYGCGDPWCYHSNYGEDFRFSPVPEETTSNSTTKRPSRASTFNSQVRSKSSPPKVDKCKDACVQTYEMIDKCTSPFLKVDDTKKVKKRAYGTRRKTEPIGNTSEVSYTPDSLDSQKTRRAIRGTSRLRGLPHQTVKNSSGSGSDPNKKPRTVHIDVYCTGTELDSDSSSSSTDSDDKTASSPQTVFESGKVKITHKRSEDDLPYHLKKDLKIEPKRKESDASCGYPTFFKGDLKRKESDDGMSSAYPSRSSLSGMRDLDSSFSSVNPSWSTMSMSSYALPDDESLANTSWKDTVSDFGSLSRSSLAQTESLDFVPRRLISTQSSIDEQPELQRLNTPVSIQGSDSFEYANSEDKSRIKKMENLWAKPWKSPQVERKHLLQQQKIKEYIEKRIGGKESESGESDDSEKGWSFVKDENKLERDSTVRKASSGDVKKAVKSPSVLIIKQKMSKDPSLRAPFTVLPGVFTEQREIAKRFGRIVDVFKKPGHHIGPAKNPDCSCDTCRDYYAGCGFRGRTRSMDTEFSNYYNWKGLGRGSEPPKDNKEHVGYTDF